MARRLDLIVVGLGAVGSAALYHAARRGLRVIGFDRFRPPHELGSSHGESRVTRLATGEGPQYVPLVARSHEIWWELEAETGVALFHQTGGYFVNPDGPSADLRWGSFVDQSARVAESAGVAFERRTAEQLRAELPQVILSGREQVGYEPTGGIVMPERAIAVQLELAEVHGGGAVFDQTVTSVEPVAGGVRVESGGERYEAAAAIVCTGAWFPDLAPEADARSVSVTRQVVQFFEVDDPTIWSTGRFPFIIWAGGSIEEYTGVFPIPPDGRGALKVLGEQFHTTTTPEAVDRTVTDEEIDDFYERLVVPRLRGVRRTCRDAYVCLYTSTDDGHFLVDRHPDSDRIIYASPCSGHGFKHSTGLAEAMVEELTVGKTLVDLEPFARR